jgi:hypothetical protein
MAILTPQQLDEVRQAYTRPLEFNGGVSHRRPVLNAAVQAIEDTLTGTAVQNALSSAIDAAITPATMTNAQKRALIKQAIAALGRRFS